MRAATRSIRASIATACAALASFGCANVRTESAPGFAIEKGSTYAWVAEPTLEADSLPLHDADLFDTLRSVVDARFAAIGLERRPRGSADHALRARVRVEEVQRDLDTEFSMYLAEVVEVGHLTLVLERVDDPQQRWEATATDELRMTAYVSGGVIPARTTTDEERAWDLAALVRDIAAHVPVVAAR